MDHKTAATILIKMLEKYPLTDEEKEAARIAIGILSWTYLAKSKIKAQKAKKLEHNSKSTSFS